MKNCNLTLIVFILYIADNQYFNMSKTAKKYILIELLEAFSTVELESLSRFIESPYHNLDQRVIKLLKALKKYALNKKIFDTDIQTKVYKAVFLAPTAVEITFSKKQDELLRAKMSILLKLAQRFLMIEAIEEKSIFENELLHKKLLEKKQFRLLNRRLTKSKKWSEQQKVKGLGQYTHDYLLATNQMNMFSQQGLLIKKDNFPALITNLDITYLLHKLKLHITMCSIMQVTNTKQYDFEPMTAIDALLKLPQYADNPLIFLYKTVIELIKTNKEVAYIHLLNQLEIYADLMPRSDLADFYTVACNFCVRQIRLGEISYNKKLLILYKRIEAQNLLLEKNVLQIVKLKNIVALSCKNNEFEWAINIINKYCPLLEEAIQKSVFHFNMGAIEFYKGNYKMAISHLIRMDESNLTYDYHLDCKMLLLKSYYQIDTFYDERTMRIFRSTEQFVQTNKSISITIKKSYKNFTLLLINLYRVRHKMGKRTLESIQNKLEKMEFVSDKKWLLEQIMALNNKKTA